MTLLLRYLLWGFLGLWNTVIVASIHRRDPRANPFDDLPTWYVREWASYDPDDVDHDADGLRLVDKARRVMCERQRQQQD